MLKTIANMSDLPSVNLTMVFIEEIVKVDFYN